jgi:hypothetical protein
MERASFSLKMIDGVKKLIALEEELVDAGGGAYGSVAPSVADHAVEALAEAACIATDFSLSLPTRCAEPVRCPAVCKLSVVTRRPVTRSPLLPGPHARSVNQGT